jgi:hypothetical protein
MRYIILVIDACDFYHKRVGPGSYDYTVYLFGCTLIGSSNQMNKICFFCLNDLIKRCLMTVFCSYLILNNRARNV